jgi:5-methylcytosine-specific restriction enzyme A
MFSGILQMFGLAAATISEAIHAPPVPGHARSGRWPSVRREHLRQEPDCQVCGTLKDCDVHHVKPFHLYPELELSPTNLVTLCGAHHLLFGHLMYWAAHNPDVILDVALWRGKIGRRPRGERLPLPLS